MSSSPLTATQRRFNTLLDEFPFAKSFFDVGNRKLDRLDMELALAEMSPREQQVTRFLAGIWLGRNDFNFDLIAAVKCVKVADLDIIIEWLEDPFFTF